MGDLRANDRKIVVQWGTRVECSSAIARLERMGELDEPGGERRTRADPVRLPVVGKGQRIALRVQTRVAIREVEQGGLWR